MSEAIISVEGLGKRYRIQHQAQRQRYTALRDVLADKTKGAARRLWSLTSVLRPPSSAGAGPSSVLRPPSSAPPSSEDFWALQDVSFEVKQGEVVGIIGRNGAGKSTLLKILSRITEPTEGRVRIKGRVASLLEVGTGFHPELTGRENIFLNGAILGMTRAEIRKKFDEIVAFAEVEKFLDTPVKRYSSGMYVRLAFAVAAHLEPEILVVDEVLAVGDAEFQKKCLCRMQEVSEQGRTVLFVSHNMGAVMELCSRAVLLQEGRLVLDGVGDKVVTSYLSAMQPSAGNFDLSSRSLRWRSLESNKFWWTQAQVVNSEGTAKCELRLEEPFELVLHGVAQAPVNGLEICFGVYSSLGVALFNTSQRDSLLPDDYPAGPITFRVKFDPNLFAPGQFFIDLYATAPTNRTSPTCAGAETIDWIRSAAYFSVFSADTVTGKRVRSNYDGVILYPCVWSARWA